MSFLFRLLIGVSLICAPLSMVVRSPYLAMVLALSALFCLIVVATLEALGWTGQREEQ